MGGRIQRKWGGKESGTEEKKDVYEPTGKLEEAETRTLPLVGERERVIRGGGG